jgi:putative phosphoribosyl transferase
LIRDAPTIRHGANTVFKDREDAGKKLAEALEHYKGKRVLVFAIPRGGAEVGFQVARHLCADFAILVARKLPYPDNPEAGFGALAEDGSTIILKEASMWLPREKVKQIVFEQSEEIKRRVQVLRKGNPLPEITKRIVILVDDGLAMGSTMRAAIELCRKRNAKKIVVAVPVAGGRIAQEIDEIADETVILEVPEFFHAVAQVYLNWYDVQDEEVLEIMRKWERQGQRLTD